MSGFWSGWVIFLIVLNLGIAFFLFIWSQRAEIPTEPDGTTGHAWAHGVLREGTRKLPRWWVLMSGAAFVGAASYLALYPGFGGFGGLLQWTAVGEHQREVAANETRLAGVLEVLDEAELDAMPLDHPAVGLGRQLYLDNCAACHGTEARGNTLLGAPNLVNGKWLYGGDPDTVVKSILDGRSGVMPPWGDALGPEGVVEVAAYVRSLSGANEPEELVNAGKPRFEAMCAACHGIDGTGMQLLGAPDLTDDDWLYGGDLQSIIVSIRDGRSGQMPAWRGRLEEQEARAIAAWLFANQDDARARENSESRLAHESAQADRR